MVVVVVGGGYILFYKLKLVCYFCFFVFVFESAVTFTSPCFCFVFVSRAILL